MTMTLYTDGACLGNPGPGGWAWAVPGGAYRSGAEELTTNQRMEITAVLEAVRANEGTVHVISDSTYVVNCFRDRWWEGWLRRGWTNTARKPVANRDLWEPLVELYLARRNELTFEWVKGHAADATNDLVDRLAVEAAREQRGREGVGAPPDLDPADVVGARDRRLPAGRLVVVAGHRPPELGGYDENPVSQRVRTRLTEILTAKKAMHRDLVVLTGLELGAEQLGAEAAREAGVPYVAALAYPDPDAVWPPASQRRFRHLLAGAERTIVLQADRPETRQRAGAALARRNGWLAAQADEAIVVWNGQDDLVGRFVRSLEDKAGEDLWMVDPGD
jgi:ribonuclease HI